MKDFSELVRLAEAATPGPWKQHLVDDTTVICSHGDVCCTFPNGGRDDEDDFDTDTERCEANAAFIAAANPQTILAITARVKELEEATVKVLAAEDQWNAHKNKEAFDNLGAALDGLRFALSGKGV